METSTLRESLTDAMRYWEPRRILYNLALAAIVIAYFAKGWPASRQGVTLNFLLLLFVLAVLANVAYCAAYLPDLFAQSSGFRAVWQKYRWILFVVGLVFAAILTRFWSLAFFSPGSQ